MWDKIEDEGFQNAHTSLSATQGYVTAGMFAGMMLGGWLWGALADRYGRKYPLMTALLINAAFGFVSAFSTNFIMFMMCRVLSGVG